ncbi:hypothetical protein R1sor_006750 [Riccia sorocarpa]|uniref:RNA polymerase Rpb7-like N-terminal domain-containing protein n=1 Tax=Riccia sorocarpa TaxID=122646 RepID=A0ABD3HRD8_9MARC
MFVLTKFNADEIHEVRVAPQNLSLPLLEAITGEIPTLFFDKVIKDVGLCITLYDVGAIEGGFVFPGDRAPRFTVDPSLFQSEASDSDLFSSKEHVKTVVSFAECPTRNHIDCNHRHWHLGMITG